MSFPPFDFSKIPDFRRLMPKFDVLLREHRTLRGMSIEQLAKQANIAPSALREIEAGKRPAPPKQVVKLLAAALQISGEEREAFLDSADLHSRETNAIFGGPKGWDETPAEPELPPAAILVFLIADIRGYTTYTERFGDHAAAKLTTEFAELAGEVVEQWEGRVVEVRGDEVLSVFASARQAVQAAGDLHARYIESATHHPERPQGIGIGLDIGEAVKVDKGYRGAALNRAARLCSLAGPGETLVSPGVYYVAPHVEGVHFVSRGQEQLKGLPEPVTILLAAPGSEPDDATSPIIDATTEE